MSALSALELLLKNDPVQSALEIDDLLGRIREELQSNKKLGSLVKYKIMDRGQSQQARLNKLLHFKGPEEATLELLEQKDKDWMENPSTFWSYGLSPRTSHPHGPQAQIRCACILLAEYRSQKGNSSEISIIDEVCLSGIPGFDRSRATTTVHEMITAGSRYRNLEMRLGLGICLVLGKSLKESSWCEVLPKSGQKLEEVVQHLQNTPVVNLARKYGDLRNELVNYQLRALGCAPVRPRLEVYGGAATHLEDLDFGNVDWNSINVDESMTFWADA